LFEKATSLMFQIFSCSPSLHDSFCFFSTQTFTSIGLASPHTFFFFAPFLYSFFILPGSQSFPPPTCPPKPLILRLTLFALPSEVPPVRFSPPTAGFCFPLDFFLPPQPPVDPFFIRVVFQSPGNHASPLGRDVFLRFVSTHFPLPRKQSSSGHFFPSCALYSRFFSPPSENIFS